MQELVGERYRIERTLGQGGMAVVHQALDTATGQRLALKQLRAAEQGRHVALFEREFLTLAHLAHPRVVTAYDYGIDRSGPYYTMELLDGGDLHQLAPVDWRRACALARDVCCALSLLHSRRLVYRDLSPRNVRCTSDGLAKLIDFGAMTPMGPSKEWVGTLPACAPEAIQSQALDARTDLYALGATLYYTLVKRHAYPARDVGHLYDLWELGPPPPPSELVPGIPEALDRLVLDLIHKNADARPASAAEVMERLSAIAGLPVAEELLVSQAYLSTPTLVGRAEQLVDIRKIVQRSLRKRGASLLIRGASGSGRSRLLDVCVLEAKLAGALVLHADSTEAHRGSYGVVRTLAEQLLDAAPELARQAAESKLSILGHVVPELLVNTAGVVLEAFDEPIGLNRRAQPALRQWLLDVSEQRPLLIVADDVHTMDEESAALLALLSSQVRHHALVVAVTAESEAVDSANALPALRLLAQSSILLVAKTLDVDQTEELLSSVFGRVPNLSIVAQRVYTITGGNPRDIMRIAQHLLAEKIVRFKHNVWSLPPDLSVAQLPSSVAEALKARVRTLSADARQLAQTMACAPRQRFEFEECLLFTDHAQLARLMQSLDELVAAEIVRSAGQDFVLGQEGWVNALESELDRAQISRSHLRIAKVFERRGDQFRLAQHLLRGGEEERGLDMLIEHARASQQQTDANPAAYFDLLQSLPEDWFAFYEFALRVAEEHGRPRRQVHQLRSRLTGMVAIFLISVNAVQHFSTVLEQLAHDSGLDLYAAMDDSLPPEERLKRALQQAGQRYAAAPELERVLDPMSAIPQLARAMIQAMGMVVSTNDYTLWKQLPSVAPFVAISPAIGVITRLVQGLGARIMGRTEEALDTYRELLERLAQPDLAGLDASHHLHTRLRIVASIGMHEASMGLRSCLARADEIAPHPLWETNALLIRMLYHLWQGDNLEAERCSRQVEVLRIENASRQVFDGQHLLFEVFGHALADDLSRLKRSVDSVEALARVLPVWAPMLHYGLGEYHRICGDHARALAEIDTALDLVEPGCHQAWPRMAGARVRTLFELGRYQEARASAEGYLSAAEEARLGYAQNYIRMPLSLALSRLGEHAAAVDTAENVISSFAALGTTGLNLAVAYQTRAIVAIQSGDSIGFEHHAALAAGQLPNAHHRVLDARRLTGARRKGEPAEAASDPSSVLSELTSRVEGCRTLAERAHCGLEILVRNSGAAAGALFTNGEQGLTLSAHIGDFESMDRVEGLARDFFQTETGRNDVTQSLSGPAEAAPAGHSANDGRAQRHVPVLLSHESAEGVALTGVVMLIPRQNSRLILSGPFARELSQLLLDVGDAKAIYI